MPERLHVVLGTSEVETFRPADVDAYLRVGAASGCARTSRSGPRRIRGRASTARAATSTRVCRERWKADDHLTRVASIRRDQIGKLATVDVTTLTALARGAAGSRACGGSRRRWSSGCATRRRFSSTATAPASSRTTCSRPRSGAGSGSCRRRRRATCSSTWRAIRSSTRPRGLEFLFGVLWREPDGSTTYRPFWAHDRDGERRAFEEFVDFVVERRRAFPDMHVYHYAAYEPVDARAADGHARDARGGDRRAPARRGARRPAAGRAAGAARRASSRTRSRRSRSSFFTREADVGSGNEAVIEFERWLDDRDPARLDAIAAYNEEDCLATLELRDWLLDRRPEAEREHGVAIPFLPPPERDGAGAETRRARRTRRHASATRCSPSATRATAGCSRRGCSSTTGARRARAGGGTSAGCEMTDEELVDDGEALGCLEHDGSEPVDLDRESASKSLEWTFTFPPQQHQFDEGDGGEDPREDGTGWTVSAIDNATGAVTLRRGKAMRDERLPTSLVPGGPFRTKAQQAALRRLAASLLAGDGRYPHLERAAAARAAARRRAAAVPRARRAARAARPARGLVPRRPGAARARARPTAARGSITHLLAAGAEGRGHGAEPQGDPQPARRGRGGGGRGGARVQRDQAAATTTRAST